MARVLEGTFEEIKAHDVDLAGRNVRLIIDPQIDDELAPSFSVQSKAHLEELLLQGLQSGSLSPTTADDRDEILQQGRELAVSHRSSTS